MRRRERRNWMFGIFLFLVVLLNITGPVFLYLHSRGRLSIDYDSIQGTILSEKLNSASFPFPDIVNRAQDVISEMKKNPKTSNEYDSRKHLAGALEKKVNPKPFVEKKADVKSEVKGPRITASENNKGTLNEKGRVLDMNRKPVVGKKAVVKSEVDGPRNTAREYNKGTRNKRGRLLDINLKPEVGKPADVKSFRQKLRAPQVEAIEEALEGLYEDDAPEIAAQKNKVGGNIFESDLKNAHVEEEKREDRKVNPRNDTHSYDNVLPGTFDYDSDWFQTDVNLDDDDNNNDVYAFSAHYDVSDTVVKVVALTPTFQAVSVFCRLETNGEVLASVDEGVEVKMKDHHAKSYTAAIILCKVHNGAQPARLAVIQDKNQTPTKYMKVNYPKKDHYAFSVCVTPFSPVYGDAYELVQNTELGIILGAEHFTFYVQSASGPVPNYLEKYQERGVAEVLPWSPLIDEVHAYGQIAAIQDCLYRNKATSDYILFQDINEIFMPLKHKSWKDLIEAKLKHEPKVAAIVFRKSFFPLADARDFAGIEEYYIPLIKKYKLYVLSNPWRESKVWDVKMRSKFIVIPNRVVSLGIVNNVNKFKDGYTSMTMDTQDGLLYQYHGQKDESKPLVTDTSARRFMSDLIERVAEAWNDEATK
ncbi:uncharacterized protein [Haliotis asinina]|uniref:uncharacterized protein n=1 Tax=Haliotis asinina TaxID=109174 RepID=UPI003531B265